MSVGQKLVLQAKLLFLEHMQGMEKWFLPAHRLEILSVGPHLML